MLSSHYSASNTSDETLVSEASLKVGSKATANVARTDPAAGLAMLMQDYGYYGSAAFNFKPHGDSASASSSVEKDKSKKAVRADKVESKSTKKPLYADDFMRMYGMSGMSLEGANMNHFTGASRKLDAGKTDSSSSKTRGKLLSVFGLKKA